MHRRRDPRPVRELDVDVPVGGGPLRLPELGAGPLVERQQPLVAVHGPAARGLLIVENEDPSVRHRGSGEPAADRHAPRGPQAALGETLDDAAVAPDRIAVDAAPLRPVLRAERDGQAGSNGNGGHRTGGPRCAFPWHRQSPRQPGYPTAGAAPPGTRPPNGAPGSCTGTGWPSPPHDDRALKYERSSHIFQCSTEADP